MKVDINFRHEMKHQLGITLSLFYSGSTIIIDAYDLETMMCYARTTINSHEFSTHEFDDILREFEDVKAVLAYQNDCERAKSELREYVEFLTYSQYHINTLSLDRISRLSEGYPNRYDSKYTQLHEKIFDTFRRYRSNVLEYIRPYMCCIRADDLAICKCDDVYLVAYTYVDICKGTIIPYNGSLYLTEDASVLKYGMPVTNVEDLIRNGIYTIGDYKNAN